MEDSQVHQFVDDVAAAVSGIVDESSYQVNPAPSAPCVGCPWLLANRQGAPAQVRPRTPDAYYTAVGRQLMWDDWHPDGTASAMAAVPTATIHAWPSCGCSTVPGPKH